jgi:parallel beta-helix repeat protein
LWYSGISINNVSFGIIENNTIKSNIGGGVGIDSSSNISVKGNNFSENHHGIRCQFSNFTNITSNIFNSDKVGIYLEYYCDYSQIENNTINSNETGIELISNAWQLVPKFVYIADNTITGGSQGIYLRCGTYNTISSNSIYGGVYGIYLDPFQTCGFFLNNTSIINNIIFNNNYGIYLYNSSNNTLTNNTINNNTQYGIYLESSSDNNALINNIIDNNNEGIVLAYSSNASLFNNSLNNNMINFNVIGSDISHFSHNIDTSNTIDGKSTYYLTNCKDLEINESSNAGFVALTSCNNVTIKNLNLTRNGYGILFINTTNSIVFNITLIDNDYGIYLNSSNSTLINIKSHSNNLDFYSTNSFSNAINFNLSSLLINFTSKDIAFKPATNPGNIPQGYNHIGKFINITNNSADSCIYLNVSYKDDEVSGINESTLRIWKYNDSWYNCSNFASECGVDTVNNVVYANITSFSIFAPLGIDLPPTIENVSITSKTSNSATIIWQTNEPSNSTIYYGTDLNLSDNMTNSSFVINHSITLTGLSASTTYYFNITSCDVAGNCNTSGYYNFTTLSAPTGGGGGAGGGE